MKLVLAQLDGTVVESWILDNNLPLDEQHPDVFDALLRHGGLSKQHRELVEAELEHFSRRADAESA